MVSGGRVGGGEGEGEVAAVEVAAVAVADEEEVAQAPAAARELVVGYALTSKKAKSFLQPKLRGLARKKGILFVAIDQKRPLSDQGPFDIVLHKLTGREWQQLLEEYREEHPEVTVLDPPGAIEHLLNRQSMLQEVSELDLSDCHDAAAAAARDDGCGGGQQLQDDGPNDDKMQIWALYMLISSIVWETGYGEFGRVGVPKQLFVNTDPSSIPAAVMRAGLSLPLVAKPLVAKSHELSLAYDPISLTKLEPPLVLQEFVNHGGVLFKVYIVGDAIRVVRRFSLPNVDVGDLPNNAGVFRFPRVSCASANADDADLDPHVAELPPRPLLEILARELRRRLGLRLFNIDMIREHGTRDRFYVIDMNYFPGYGKMPGYEHVFTDFLLSLVQKEYKRRPSYSSCEG
uniref:Inositol-tetrakisphosphate 1-kinase n=1 Tax=Oryza punctata TaxID=4537 RepID=A0A0E0KIG6_ORYPU